MCIAFFINQTNLFLFTLQIPVHIQPADKVIEPTCAGCGFVVHAETVSAEPYGNGNARPAKAEEAIDLCLKQADALSASWVA